MVHFEIPSQYTFSPSEGTPQLTINREATVDLDSSNAFEGPEKLLEVWFAPAADALPPGTKKDGLKAVQAETWKEMLDLVNCKVLSVVESEHIDAYLLSESSMFVFPHKLILKTCGTTTLLLGIRRMLRIAAVEAGFPSHNTSSLDDIKTAATPYRVFYSRKNFLFPDKQHGPHRSWKQEVKFLDDMFLGGSAYMVGKMNGDHWYLYLTTPNTTLTPPRTPDNERVATETKILKIPTSSAFAMGQRALENDDETLEVLMTDLDPENAKQFYLEHASAVAEGKYSERADRARREAANSLGDLSGANMTNSTLSGSTAANDETFDVFSQTSSDNGAFTPDDDVGYPEELSTEGHALGTVVSETCGLSDVYPTSKYPDARVDAYLFTPCGFSANGVIPAPDQAGTATHYFTVHVTPELQCSYASFETNVPGRQTGRETHEVIEHVVNIFKPGRFSVTLFEAKTIVAEVRDLGLDGDGVAKAGLLRSAKMEKIRGYRRLDRIVHEFDGYDLVFRYYERDGWVGGGPRLGEVD
ncbi:S-adenosylmethionine decarboxylase [Mollisia scopiformis]|uniref:adenosylmethionine decarboxylase n=1 Tax=Mollisia scopiformis TaxID=149040 RepID=A0A194XBQ7_MOLSC|nr:S-adenosylmethionine decarboxylase [Mollisia scopiformis]KUJ17593.1 S-adenosylmethionine decarboxylase [Mollisia scopiformis]